MMSAGTLPIAAEEQARRTATAAGRQCVWNIRQACRVVSMSAMGRKRTLAHRNSRRVVSYRAKQFLGLATNGDCLVCPSAVPIVSVTLAARRSRSLRPTMHSAPYFPLNCRRLALLAGRPGLSFATGTILELLRLRCSTAATGRLHGVALHLGRTPRRFARFAYQHTPPELFV